MITEPIAIFGIFRPGNEVKKAVNILLLNGFSNSNIKALYPTTESKLDIDRLQKTMALPFAKIGACVGATTLFIIGLFIVFSSFDIGSSVNIGFLNKASILIIAALFGVFVGASSGALIGIGTPQPIILRFVGYMDAGATLLSVKVQNLEEEDVAKNMFKSCGARDIARLDEKETWETIHKNKCLI